MTAIFMARLPDGIVATADGAFYGREGRLSGTASKLILMPEVDCIITLQGPFFYHPGLRERLAAAGGFDTVLGCIVRVVRDLYAAHENDQGHSRAFAMLIGGFSAERQAWETYWLNSEPWEEALTQAPYEPWQLAPAWATAWTPGYGREASIAAGIDPDRPLNEQGFDVVEAGIRVICAARFEPIPIHRDPANGTCQVGGFVQFARLERGRAYTELVHRWADPIGERLDPMRGVLEPTGAARADRDEPRIDG